MTANVITRNQRRLLRGVYDLPTLSEQANLAGEIWPYKFGYMRKSWSRLQNLGFIEWISQGESYEDCYWQITDEGIKYLAQTGG